MTAKQESTMHKVLISILSTVGGALLMWGFYYMVNSGSVHASEGVEIKELKLNVDELKNDKLNKSEFIIYKVEIFDKYMEKQDKVNEKLIDFIDRFPPVKKK